MMKKYFAGWITAAIATLSLMLGLSVVTAAPASAVWGSRVGYYNSSFPTERLRTQNMGGAWYFQAIGTYIDNVYQTCPPNSSRRLWYQSPSGATGLLGYGTCLRPSQPGWYDVRIRG